MLNILFYKYIPIKDLVRFEHHYFSICKSLNLKGRILFGSEGINGSLSGSNANIAKFKREIKCDPRFIDMQFKQGITKSHNFKKLFIRQRREIVTSQFNVKACNDNYIKPQQLLKELDAQSAGKSNKLILLDVRNNYETKIGKFHNAITLNLETFRDFTKEIKKLEHYKENSIVTYCTGGVRCEKAVTLLRKQGFTKVRQLHGGILNYGQKCSNKHWEGKCFVFDTRGAIEIDPKKQTIPISQCELCKLPCDNYYNCKLATCDKRFISCKDCLNTLQKCCSKKCRSKLK